jgi:hypothetical protein
MPKYLVGVLLALVTLAYPLIVYLSLEPFPAALAGLAAAGLGAGRAWW